MPRNVRLADCYEDCRLSGAFEEALGIGPVFVGYVDEICAAPAKSLSYSQAPTQAGNDRKKC
jgi:hypothetical protein